MKKNSSVNGNLIVINKPKKILVATGIYPPDIGGPATYSKLLKEELPKYSKDKVRAIILNFGEVRKYPKIIRHLIYFFKALYRGRYCDFIYAQDPVSVGLPAMWAAKILKKPFLLKVVGDYAWEQGTARFGVSEVLDTFSKSTENYHWFVKLLKKIEKSVALSARLIIVPSEYLKTVVVNWGIPAEKIVVIYNSFDRPKEMESKEVVRRKMKIVGQVVISAGRLVPWKGFDVLIKFWPELLKNYPDAKLLIVGEGPDRKKLEDLILEHGVSESVMLTGQIEKKLLLVYLRVADVFVLNTGYEGFSHQLLEASSLGTPIVTTKVGGNPEIVKDGVNGFLIEYNDSIGIKTAISKIFADPVLSTKLSMGGMAKADEFSVERMITNLIKTMLSCAS